MQTEDFRGSGFQPDRHDAKPTEAEAKETAENVGKPTFGVEYSAPKATNPQFNEARKAVDMPSQLVETTRQED